MPKRKAADSERAIVAFLRFTFAIHLHYSILPRFLAPYKLSDHLNVVGQSNSHRGITRKLTHYPFLSPLLDALSCPRNRRRKLNRNAPSRWR